MTAPAAAGVSAPAQGVSLGAGSSAGGTAGASSQSGGLSFNNLLNGSDAGAAQSDSLPASGADTAASVGGDVLSGDTAPPSGNVLPLLVALLPPLPLQAQPQPAVTPATSGTATVAAPVSGTPASQAFLPTLPPAVLNPQGEAKNATIPPLPAAALSSLAAQADDAAQTQARTERPVQITPGIPLDLSALKQAIEAAQQRPLPPTSAAPATPAATNSAATSGADTNVDDNGVLRQFIAALSQASGRQLPTPPAIPAGPVAADKVPDMPQPQPVTISADKLQLANATGPVGQQLLREFKFERTAEASAPTPATPTNALSPHALHTAAAADDAPVLQLPTPVHAGREWSNGLGDRIVWMTQNNLQNAQIRLNPPHLGPIDVQVSVTDNQTNVSLVAHHGTTREALEAAAPRLRDILGSQGLGNVNVNINHQASGERSPTPQEQVRHSYVPQELDTAPIAATPSRPARGSTLLDTYA